MYSSYEFYPKHQYFFTWPETQFNRRFIILGGQNSDSSDAERRLQTPAKFNAWH